jgi:DNA-binding NtrC family response regulator
LKDTGKMRILIAEDDTALAGFVRKGLEAEHYAVDVSNGGEQARALATELDYDLLVLDLNLPRLDGVNILRRVRAEKPNLPVVVLRCGDYSWVRLVAARTSFDLLFNLDRTRSGGVPRSLDELAAVG